MAKWSLGDELDALRAAVTRPAPDAPAGPDTAATGETGAGLDDLAAAISGHAEDVEALVREHPLAALAVAFALGVVAGRLTGGIG